MTGRVWTWSNVNNGTTRHYRPARPGAAVETRSGASRLSEREEWEHALCGYGLRECVGGILDAVEGAQLPAGGGKCWGASGQWPGQSPGPPPARGDPDTGGARFSLPPRSIELETAAECGASAMASPTRYSSREYCETSIKYQPLGLYRPILTVRQPCVAGRRVTEGVRKYLSNMTLALMIAGLNYRSC